MRDHPEYPGWARTNGLFTRAMTCIRMRDSMSVADSLEDAGYCLDAPSHIPAGSTKQSNSVYWTTSTTPR